MRTEFAIVGAGMAGLSAANRLADRGADAVLIDAGRLPAHKVCGEFLSPECIPILRNWGIEPPVTIDKARYHWGGRALEFELPAPAAGCSRYQLDHLLAQRAGHKGVHVITGTRVLTLKTPGETDGVSYDLELESGETVKAANLLVGTGRIPGVVPRGTPPRFRYVGYKMHFRGLDLAQTLVMFTFAGAYVGMANVAPGLANLACLATEHDAAPVDGTDAYVRALCERPGGAALRELLASAEPVFADWMTARVPAFGPRRTPRWPRALFIGDAAGSIHPATGNGLGMAMTGGIMAADMALEGAWASYTAAWRRRYIPRLRWGSALHQAMLRPALSRAVGATATRVPALARYVFSKTREVQAACR